MMDWKEFREELELQLSELPAPRQLTSEATLLGTIDGLMRAIQDTVQAKVPVSRQSPHSKRWWNKELSMLKRKKNQLSNASYKYRAVPDHPIHEEHRVIRNQYMNEIRSAKKAHWADFLEGMAGGDIWVVNH